jgi:hypothetical protein
VRESPYGACCVGEGGVEGAPIVPDRCDLLAVTDECCDLWWDGEFDLVRCSGIKTEVRIQVRDLALQHCESVVGLAVIHTFDPTSSQHVTR